MTLTILCAVESRLSLVTEIFELKNKLSEMPSCACELVQLNFVALCLVSCFTVGLLQTKQLTSGDHWRGGHEVTETLFLIGAVYFPSPLWSSPGLTFWRQNFFFNFSTPCI